jgi:CDP-glycerol glycerophosphotransferase
MFDFYKIPKYFRRKFRCVLYLRKYSSYFFKLFPIRSSVIFFESHRGISYSDNPKAICEAILEEGLPILCVWSLVDRSCETPSKVKKVKRFSVAYYYYHLCSKVLIHNGEFAQNIPIRKKQIYINTQHGTPLKFMGIDVKVNGIEKTKESYSKNGRWNYLLSPNPYATEIFRRAYIYSGRILEGGYPRNDILLSKNTESDINFLKSKYKLPQNKSIILYAPTWRDCGGTNLIKENFKLQLNLKNIFDSFSETHVVILRLHHLIKSSEQIDGFLSIFVFDFSSAKYDIQELMLISDILITDYSSVMFDYTNLWRPIIFFAYDLDLYSTITRGTYFDLEDNAPGPVVKTMDEVIASIKTIRDWFPEFAEKRKSFHNQFCLLESGAATERVINEIIKPEMKIS